jgi:hypothetical protein
MLYREMDRARGAERKGVRMIIALAGRRIDAPDAPTPRFPPANVPLVLQRLDDLLEREGATALVSSAACGSDLVALQAAGARGMRRRIVLPFDRDRFRATSVTDRGGDWGQQYDRLLAELERRGDVVTLTGHGEGTEAYVAVNAAILNEAAALAQPSGVQTIAVLVWEGAPRGDDDITAAFGEEARRRGLRLEQVKTT